MNVAQMIDEAIASFNAGSVGTTAALARQVLANEPRHNDALFLLGTVAYVTRDYHRSIALLTQVVEQNPEHIKAYLHLGNASQDIGNYQHAIECYEHVLHHEPENDIAYTNMGNVYFKLEQFDQAKRCHEKSIALNPHNWISYNNLARVLRQNGGDEVYALADNILTLPHVDQSWLLAYALLKESCQWDKLTGIQGDVLSVIRSGNVDLRLLSMLLLSLNSLPDLSPEEVFEVHRLYGQQLERAHAGYQPGGHRQALEPASRLRIGYLSPDFRHHAVGNLFCQPFLHHDVERFETYCYSDTRDEDDLTQVFKDAAHSFVNVTQMTDAELAQRIEADGIHVLVDLAGHTTGNRLAVLARRPAPVQITYQGYPNTTGLDAVDYRITDRYAEASSAHLYTEELLMMPESFLCFGHLGEPSIEPRLPASRHGHITFGSCNNITKLTPVLIQIWSRILHHVPSAKLRIKSAQADRPMVQRQIRHEFAQHGIDGERADLQGFLSNSTDHLDFYNAIDIALDTFPYSGTATTCDALWMGVPVVTLVGRAHAQRVSYSILKNVGIEETIATSEEQYVDIATGLAHDLPQLDRLRQAIPSKLRQSILCHPERFTPQLEQLYLEAWQRKGFPLTRGLS